MAEPSGHPSVADHSAAGPGLLAEPTPREEVDFVVRPASDGVAWCLPDGCFREASASCRALLGWEFDQLRGQPLFNFCHPDEVEALRTAWQSVAAGGVNFCQRFRRSDGQFQWLQTSLFPSPGGAEVLAVFRLAEEHRVLEEQLRQAQKMAAIGWLTASVAHDFNNLLTVIKGYAELMASRQAADDPLHRPLQEIRKATDRAALLVRQILTVVRKRAASPQILELNALLTELDPMIRRLVGDRIEVITVLDHQSRFIVADPGQVEQLLLNLAANARDAMPNGGRLSLHTRVGSLPGLADPIGQAPYLCLSVRDTGIGMDEPTRSRLFEPFFTTKALGKGTGLGLTTVSGIVRQVGGHIEVETAPGAGTTFHVYLPIA